MSTTEDLAPVITVDWEAVESDLGPLDSRYAVFRLAIKARRFLRQSGDSQQKDGEA